MNDLTKQQNHSTSCPSFNFEIFNFKNFTCPFGLRHEIHYPSSRSRDFRAAEGLGGGQIGEPVTLVNVTETEYIYKYNGQEWQDELGLGWDANFGLLGYRTQVHNGLNIREWRASDIENQIRSQMGSPLRSSYNGLNLLDSRNNPVRVSGTGNPTIDYIINMYSIFE